jgi:amino acid transporter
MYTWSARAFGPFAGFITAWTYWTGTLSFLPTVLYFIAGSSLLWSPTSTTAAGTPGYFVGFSLVVLTLCAILNVRGLQVAKWLNSAGAVARWVGILLLVGFAVGSWIRFGPATNINRHTIMPTFRYSDVIFWTALAFAWTGPEAVSFMSGEIQDSRRTVPRALAIAAPMIAAVYIVGTASILLAIPPDRASGVYGVVEAMRTAAANLHLSWLVPLAAACVVAFACGSAHWHACRAPSGLRTTCHRVSPVFIHAMPRPPTQSGYRRCWLHSWSFLVRAARRCEAPTTCSSR